MSEIILYRTPDGASEIRLRAEDGSVWLSQQEIAELFLTTKQNVNLHLKNIFQDTELKEDSTVKESLIVGVKGRSYPTSLYNLEAILAVGYRINSPRGTQFRQWATTALKEYLVKGFVINDERLKNPGEFDYFDELLERIREIRASEKRFYQKVRDLYSTAADYDPKSDAAQTFFATVQNKMLYAVTEHTAAELITARADAAKPNMGLTSWKGSHVRKIDITTAKNYLATNEISELNRIVTMFLDFAEDRAMRRETMLMRDWEEQLERFLAFNERKLLKSAGAITANEAEQTACQQYDAFDAARRQAEMEQAEREHMDELNMLGAQIESKPKRKNGNH